MSDPAPRAAGEALIALGANLGDPLTALRQARDTLADLGTVTGTSWLYRTRAVGGPDGQPDYLNAALSLQTPLGPQALMLALLGVEALSGRVRLERWGPRVLDLDLIGYGDAVLHTPRLTLPHPQAFARAFVLAPLRDIAPHWQHPVHGQSVQEALRDLSLDGLERLPERL
ncbi:2-amino-4-hydroxy-6-hydroxymethyldihydropteridine diphosphokinase [Deinococcus aquiradiocola]|uniref:2-amino-4-hydroxy-6-hydroxymethyldihydropteridine diphosphokinase n=1 Tax=Deinococcus aquiradiocola TaxID=393059 RepID=A0A917PRK5_9DEIO|nr:2-amino-4-hydroxy-6-hydroxymethyldihydropteridine diphosphokinase [Deinococcus aquiradiocola]GGJ88772.1 2-amino-4-hydroxy-6-hydroxymethyldihydropteridine diphosphokinase [Deinococcus aquiradiocola]